MNEDVFWCLGNPTVYMRELSPFIHSPHRMLILASPRKGSDLEFRSTPLAPFFPANTVSDSSYTDANRP